MCISHSAMEGQRHNNPLNPRCFCLQRPKRNGKKLLTHAIEGRGKGKGSAWAGTILLRKPRGDRIILQISMTVVTSTLNDRKTPQPEHTV